MMNRNGLAAVLVMLAVSAAGAQERPAEAETWPPGIGSVSEGWENGWPMTDPFPMPSVPAPDPHPAVCAMFCEFGYKDDCHCANGPAWTDYPPLEDGYACQDLALQHWYAESRCVGMAGGLQAALEGRKSAGSGLSGSALQRRLREVLLGYCDTYPEFAAAVLPMLDAPGSEIFYRDGFVNISAGDRLMRFGGGLSRWAAAEQAALAVGAAAGAV